MNMGKDAIDRIIAEKRAAQAVAEPPPLAPPPLEPEEDRFFSVLSADGINEEFLEFRSRNGDVTCFPFSDLNWFHWDAENGSIDLDFGVAMVIVKGRGLMPKLFHGIKSKRVAWVKEADTEMQDHKANEAFIAEIRILPAESGDEEETAEAE